MDMCTVYAVFVYFFQGALLNPDPTREIVLSIIIISLKRDYGSCVPFTWPKKKVELQTKRVCLEDVNLRWGKSTLSSWRKKVSQMGQMLNLWSLAQRQDS